MTASRPSSSLTERRLHAQPTISGESPRPRNPVRRMTGTPCSTSRWCAPRLQPLPDLLGFAVARHDDVHMVRAAIDGVESPPPAPGNDRQWSIPRAGAGPGREGRHHPSGGPARVASGIGKLPTVAHSTHPRSPPGSQVTYVGQVRKEAKGSAKAVRNQVSLCFSSVIACLVHRCPLS